MVLDMRLGQRRAHAVAERDQWQVGVLGAGDVGELPDVGRHVTPRAHARPSEFAGCGGSAVSAQVEGVDNAAFGRQEAGQPVVSAAVFGAPMRDLHGGPRTNPAGREPLSYKYWDVIDL